MVKTITNEASVDLNQISRDFKQKHLKGTTSMKSFLLLFILFFGSFSFSQNINAKPTIAIRLSYNYMSNQNLTNMEGFSSNADYKSALAKSKKINFYVSKLKEIVSRGYPSFNVYSIVESNINAKDTYDIYMDINEFSNGDLNLSVFSLSGFIQDFAYPLATFNQPSIYCGTDKDGNFKNPFYPEDVNYIFNQINSNLGIVDIKSFYFVRLGLIPDKRNETSLNNYYNYPSEQPTLNEGQYKTKVGELDYVIKFNGDTYHGKYTGEYAQMKIIQYPDPFNGDNKKEVKETINWPHGKGKFVSDESYYENKILISSRCFEIEGDWIDGLMDGNTSITKWNKKELEFTYKGQMVKGYKVGQGILEYNKMNYEGEWLNDEINGNGKLKFGNKIYDGQWKDNKKEGLGILKMTSSNETLITGQWKDDYKIGTGKIYFENKDSLIGIVEGLNNNFTGFGIIHVTSPFVDDVSLRGKYIYQGNFVKSKYSGLGKISYEKGNWKEGEWLNGQFIKGNVKLSFEDGSYYEGEIKNSQKNGKGKYIDTKGNVFEGVFTEDKFTGTGKLVNADWSYEGEIVLNEPKGKGVKIFKNGDTLSGNWNEYGFNGIGKRREASVENSDEFYYSEGTWKNGQLNGEGTRYFRMRAPFSDSDEEVFVDATYSGQFKNDLFEGRGTISFDYGRLSESIEGNWINGICSSGKITTEVWDSGKGRMCVDTYEGQFDNKFNKNGYGTYKDCDGNTYVGYFANDSKEGSGKLTYRNGTIEQGTFVNDVFQIPFICKNVTIGNQVWMAENLNVAKFRNGDLIKQIKTKEEWLNNVYSGEPAWCYYDFNPANGVKYGKLYNWYAVNDSRGLAPAGWHVPSKNEFQQLINKFGYNTGTALKSKTGWVNQIYRTKIEGGTNTTGFNGFPAGNLYFTQYSYPGYYSFMELGIGTQWWSSTCCLDFDSSASVFQLDNYACSVSDNEQKAYGNYVRLVKD